MAMSPFDIYYDTEARMYALLILLGTLTVLSVMSLVAASGPPERRSAWRCITSASLYSHYWALYSAAVLALGMAWCAWKGPYQRACRFGVVALVVGGLSFVPWLPTLWFQTHHTGTPWAAPAQLTAVVFTVTQFAGGELRLRPRARRAMFFFFAVLAVFGTPLGTAGSWCSTSGRALECGVAVGVVLGTIVLGVLAGRIDGPRSPTATRRCCSSPPSSSWPTGSRPFPIAGRGRDS